MRSGQSIPSGTGASFGNTLSSRTSRSTNTKNGRSPGDTAIFARAAVAPVPMRRNSSASIAVIPGRPSGTTDPKPRASSRSRNPTNATSAGPTSGAPTDAPHAAGPRPKATASGMSAASPLGEFSPSYRSRCPSM